MLVLLLACFAVLRLRFLEVPLERDEGDYAYIAQLMLQGVPPYSGAHEMRPPGIFGAYALILAAFGHSHQAIRLGLLLVNAASIALVYGLGARLVGALAGLVAAAVYGAFSLSPALLGFTANTEHFVLLPALGGFLLLLPEQREPRRLFASGLCFGVALLMKQHAVFFAAYAGGLVLWRELRGAEPLGSRAPLTRLLAFLSGGLLPGVLALGLLAVAGSLEDFWFWCVTYPREYVTATSATTGWRNLLATLPGALRGNAGLWALGAAGLVVLFSGPRAGAVRGFVTGLGIASLLAVCVGLKFRHHGYLFLAPPIALLAGVAADAACGRMVRLGRSTLAGATGIALIVLPVLHLLVLERDVLFRLDPTAVSRRIYRTNPFPESLVIGRYLAEHSGPDERIAVLGSEPQIYFYARRRAATSTILTYPLMQAHPYARTMQEEMIREIETERPRYLVFVSSNTSWLVRPNSDRHLFEWFTDYSSTHYRPIGLADIGPDQTLYHWAEELTDVVTRTNVWVAIYERR
jgi:hypothetical protein